MRYKKKGFAHFAGNWGRHFFRFRYLVSGFVFVFPLPLSSSANLGEKSILVVDKQGVTGSLNQKNHCQGNGGWERIWRDILRFRTGNTTAGIDACAHVHTLILHNK